MIHRAGGDRLDRPSWDEALGIVAEELREVPGERMGFFATSRGIMNETYYAFREGGAPHGFEPRRHVPPGSATRRAFRAQGDARDPRPTLLAQAT